MPRPPPPRLPFRPPLSASAVLVVALAWPSVAMLSLGKVRSDLVGELLFIAGALAASRSRGRWVAASCAFAGAALGFLTQSYIDPSAGWPGLWPVDGTIALASCGWAAILAAIAFRHVRAGTLEGADRTVMCAAPWMIVPNVFWALVYFCLASSPPRAAAIALGNVSLPVVVWVLAVRRSRARALWVRAAREEGTWNLRVLPDHPAAGVRLPRLAVPGDPSAAPGVLCWASEGSGTYRDAQVTPMARFVADVSWSPAYVAIVLVIGAVIAAVTIFLGLLNTPIE
jgi:hypothetical protein